LGSQSLRSGAIGNNTGQVSAAIFKEMAGLKTVMINYKGAAQIRQDTERWERFVKLAKIEPQ